jgi:hypothetical protein
MTFQYLHECSNCGDHIDGKCYCFECREKFWDEAYLKGIEQGRKEGYATAVKELTPVEKPI